MTQNAGRTPAISFEAKRRHAESGYARREVVPGEVRRRKVQDCQGPLSRIALYWYCPIPRPDSGQRHRNLGTGHDHRFHYRTNTASITGDTAFKLQSLPKRR